MCPWPTPHGLQWLDKDTATDLALTQCQAEAPAEFSTNSQFDCERPFYPDALLFNPLATNLGKKA